MLDYFFTTMGVGLHLYSTRRPSELSGFFLLEMFDAASLISLALFLIIVTVTVHVQNRNKHDISGTFLAVFGAILIQGGSERMKNNPVMLMVVIVSIIVYALFSGLIVSRSA